MSRKISIEASNLKKIYKKREVVKDVSLSMEKGEIVGLLGPNGAGKTTTFYMITGIIQPNYGTVQYNGLVAPLKGKSFVAYYVRNNETETP